MNKTVCFAKKNKHRDCEKIKSFTALVCEISTVVSKVTIVTISKVQKRDLQQSHCTISYNSSQGRKDLYSIYTTVTTTRESDRCITLLDDTCVADATLIYTPNWCVCASVCLLPIDVV